MPRHRDAIRGQPSAGLAIFVKTPGLSPVKSRLWPALGRELAERLYRRMAAAVAGSARPLPRSELTRYWAIAEAHPLARRCWRTLPTLPQGDGDLGSRMHTVQQALRTRHRSWLLTGADAVLLHARNDLRPALDWLAHPAPRIVFGPAADGGFWLVGGNVRVPEPIWQHPRYSSPQALGDLLDALRNAAERPEVQLLPAASDLDTIDDLPAVLSGLRASRTLQREQRRLLRQLLALEGIIAVPG
ncbi:MAG: glycosyltransferase [Xanthomonadales bacterium]|jgi:hypothetical protein|nr:glycosyltransferase [Xanthomonadales bacterium]